MTTSATTLKRLPDVHHGDGLGTRAYEVYIDAARIGRVEVVISSEDGRPYSGEGWHAIPEGVESILDPSVSYWTTRKGAVEQLTTTTVTL